MRTVLNRYLDTVGDGSGTKNANGDYSATGTNTPTDFLIRPSLIQTFVIQGLAVIVEDQGALIAAGYGALSALSTGIGLFVSKNQSTPAELDLLDGVKIKRHYDWLSLPYLAPPVDTTPLLGVSNNLFMAQLIFPEPIELNGRYAEALIVRAPAENFSGLVAHRFKARGFLGAVVY